MKNELGKMRKKKWISFLLIAILCMGFFTAHKNVMAIPSLPHIQSILKNGGTFNILEVVPEESAGTLGYYVGGQEPCKNWTEDLRGKASTEIRKTYANKMFSDMEQDGIIGADGNTPLRYTYSENGIHYNEKRIWELENESLSGWKQLVLNHEESVAVKGEMRKVNEGEEGNYVEKYSYHLQQGGSYIQKVTKFLYVTAEEAQKDFATGYYFYQPNFVEVKMDDNLELMKNTAIYTKIEGTGTYHYEGTPVTMGGLDADVKYYYTAENPELSQQYNPAKPYVAISTEFEKAPEGQTGYFVSQLAGYKYVNGGGTYHFTPDETKEAVNVSYDTVYYKGGYTNNNWFLSKVFDMSDDEINNTSVSRPQIVVNAITASKVTPELLQRANLIYLSFGYIPRQTVVPYSDEAGNNISVEAAIALNNKVAKGTPLILDLRLLDTQESRLIKLCKLCLQDTVSEIPEGTPFGSLTPQEPTELTQDRDKTFIKKNVFAFKPPFNIGSRTVNSLANRYFNEGFSASVYQEGFKQVLDEIKAENFLRKIDGTERLPEQVTLANSIRYIINAADQRQLVAPDNLRVLEIQPATTNTPITAETVAGWLGEENTISASNIAVTTMTVAEFTGKIEDINELYDIIYIGADETNLNRNGIYNSVDYRAYNGIGQTVRVNLNMAGLLNRDYDKDNPQYDVNGNPTAPINAKDGSFANQTRFSGNDITIQKGIDLKNFALAGYPIVLADNLVLSDSTNITGNGIRVNTYEVDNSSNIYDALHEIIQKPNVMKTTQVKDTIGEYLKVSKPKIEYTEVPPIYDEDGESDVLKQEGTLTYTFKIINNTDTTPKATTYDCNLYIDVNADGRFKENEMLNDIEITKSGSANALNPTEVDGKMRYSLEADVEYVVKRQMPQGKVGIIPWKLSVVKNGASHIHASMQNYTRIPAEPGNRQKIKVLQIVQTGEDRLNLAKSPTYTDLIKNLKDFDIEIETIDTAKLSQKGNVNTIFEYFKPYDMLIIGFNDTYDGISKNSAEAITQFINSKKSVLFTHDTTSFYGLPYNGYPRMMNGRWGDEIKYDISSGWGYYFNTVIRDAVGLDRYGVTSKFELNTGETLREIVRQGDTSTKAKEAAILAAGRSVAYAPGGNKGVTVSEAQGYTNYTLKRFTNYDSINWYALSNKENGYSGANEVSQVNQGQITSYPFDINLEKDKTMKIVDTHEQYFQVNMNTNDIVVWYCLAGGNYDKMKNDVTNAYYIYNKGNVTYTGVGHFNRTPDERTEGFQNEAKLFINTMIAAYQAGAHPPSVSIKDPTNLEYDLDAMYFMTDSTDSTVLDETQGQREIYFKITDTTIAPTKTIALNFFYTGVESGNVFDWSEGEKVTAFTSEVLFPDGTPAGELHANVVYKIRLPDAIFEPLKNSESGIKFFVQVESTIENQSLFGYDSVDLRKIGLYNLE